MASLLRSRTLCQRTRFGEGTERCLRTHFALSQTSSSAGDMVDGLQSYVSIHWMKRFA
ncbi:hypothetical protein [Pseudomonas phage phiZ98]|nr:hypothetical protein [Pseudomonas phage phiZ98]